MQEEIPADKQPKIKRKPPPNGKKWVKGQSGNPKGRPKGPTLTGSIRGAMPESVASIPPLAAIAVKLGLDPEKTTVGQLYVVCGIVHAMRGNSSLYTHIYERLEGKVPDKTEVSGPDGKPIQTETKQPFDWDAYRKAKQSDDEARRNGG